MLYIGTTSKTYLHFKHSHVKPKVIIEVNPGRNKHCVSYGLGVLDIQNLNLMTCEIIDLWKNCSTCLRFKDKTHALSRIHKPHQSTIVLIGLSSVK